MIYLGTSLIPAWVNPLNWTAVTDAFHERITRELTRFAGRIGLWEMINEMNNPNDMNDQGQALQLTYQAAQWMQSADASSKRVINSGLLLGDHFADPNVAMLEFQVMTVAFCLRTLAILGLLQGLGQTYMQFLSACISQSVDFDITGLEVSDW